MLVVLVLRLSTVVLSTVVSGWGKSIGVSLRPARARVRDPVSKTTKGRGGWRNNLRKSSTWGRNSYKLSRNDNIRHTHQDFVCLFLFLCAYALCFVCVGRTGSWCVYHSMWRAEDNFVQPLLSLRSYVGSSNWTQVSRLVQQGLGCLANPFMHF